MDEYPLTRTNDGNSSIWLVAGVSVGRLWDQPRLLNDSLSAALGLFSDGKVHPCIDSVHPFEQTALAHRRIESRSNVGKVVLVP